MLNSQNISSISSMFNASAIVSTIKSKRIEWLGRIQRMERDKCVKRIFEDKLDDRWRVGRSRLRWLDGAESDLRTVGVKRWRNMPKGREEWH
jgi:hypothetical protein